VGRDERPHRGFTQAARFGDSRHLELGCGGVMFGSRPEADVVTRSTGTGVPGFSPARWRVGVHAINELLIGWPQVRSSRTGGVIAIAAAEGRG